MPETPAAWFRISMNTTSRLPLRRRDSGSGRHFPVQRAQGLLLRGSARAWKRRRAVLYGGQGGHDKLAESRIRREASNRHLGRLCRRKHVSSAAERTSCLSRCITLMSMIPTAVLSSSLMNWLKSSTKSVFPKPSMAESTILLAICK